MTAKQSWKPVTIGGVTGILMGAGAMYAAKTYVPQEEESAGLADDTVQAVKEAGNHDDMSFGEAFQTARAEVGPGGVFRWHGNIYNTYTEKEWNELSHTDKETLVARVGAEVSPADINTEQVAQASVAVDETVDEARTEEVDNDGAVDVASVSTVDTQEDAAQVDGQVQTTDSETVSDNDVRVVGFGHVPTPNGQYVAVEELDVNGQRVAVIDVDDDGVGDIAMSDINHNQQADAGEIIDLHTGEPISFTNTVEDDAMYAGDDTEALPDVDTTLL